MVRAPLIRIPASGRQHERGLVISVGGVSFVVRFEHGTRCRGYHMLPAPDQALVTGARVPRLRRAVSFHLTRAWNPSRFRILEAPVCGRFVQFSDPEIYASHFDLDSV